jgi:hypothetical protein
LGGRSRYPPTGLRSKGMFMGDTELGSGGRSDGGEYIHGDCISGRVSLTMDLP